MIKEIKFPQLLITLAFGIICWMIPPPQGVTLPAWHLLAIFLSTILGIILKAAPMGTMSMIAITLVALTQVLAPGNPGKSVTLALSSFGDKVIWLIGLSFFIARGFIKTGLGKRIAYLFIRVFGKSSLGLAYGLGLADLVLAPAVPSNTARGGGIIYPIMKSMAINFGSVPEDPATHRRLGGYLTLSSYNMNLITSSLFLTGTASNPMCQKFARNLGIEISWMTWFVAALVPAVISIIAVPYILYKIYPPQLKSTGDAPGVAAEKLKEMGPVHRDEWLMLAAFVILLFLWITGDLFGIDATTTALIGLVFLLLSQVLTWEDVKGEKGAWDTIVWFSALVMMASFLNSLGFIPWFSDVIKKEVGGMRWTLAFPIIALVYFYSHYIFASATAHVAAMYTAFLSVGISVGIPGMLLALVLGFWGGIFGTLTHYGHGPAPVFFGSTYVDLKDWWRCGFLLSIAYLLIWMGIGGGWWKVLGIW